MDTIEPSPFLDVLRAAKAVEARGDEVLYLSMGEPDFATPTHICDAAVDAIRTGQTRYTAMDGTPALKAAIANKLERDNNLSYAPDEITVTLGGTQGIFNAMLATVGPGDEVILPAPYFPPYVSAITLAGGTPVIVETNEADQFTLAAARLDEAITDRTRWLILNSPSNPAGATLTADQLGEIADVVRRHRHVAVFSDDIYESVTYGEEPFKNLVNVAPDLRDRTVILNGVSKAYAMTGWRVGYLAGPAPLIEATSQISATSTFTPCSITQAGAVEALNASQELLDIQLAMYSTRRDLLVDRLTAIDRITLSRPNGAFYMFPSCNQFFGSTTPSGTTIKTDLDFVHHVLDSVAVATVQGSAFGTPGHFRISYAADTDTLIEAMERLDKACRQLTPQR